MATEDKTLTIEIPKPHGEQYKDIVLSEQNKKNIVREVLRAKGEFQGEFSKEMYDYIVLKEKKRQYFDFALKIAEKAQDASPELFQIFVKDYEQLNIL